MKIIGNKAEEKLKKIKSDLEIAEIIYTSPNQVYDKDVAIKKLNTAIKDIFVAIGI
jgi:hypothetical protein